MPLCERQQRDVASLLDGARDLALMRGANPGEAARNDLAAFRYEPLQQAHVAIRDFVDFLDAELADFSAAEELAPTRPGRTRSA